MWESKWEGVRRLSRATGWIVGCCGALSGFAYALRDGLQNGAKLLLALVLAAFGGLIWYYIPRLAINFIAWIVEGFAQDARRGTH